MEVGPTVARHEGRDRGACVNGENPAYPSREREKPRARATWLRARSRPPWGLERVRGSEGCEVVAHAWRACASPKGEPEREPASNPRARATPRELWTARAASALWDGESAKRRLRRVLGLCAREGPRAADAENHGRSPATPSRRRFSERDRGMLLSRGRLLLVWEKCRSATASGEPASGKRGAVAFFPSKRGRSPVGTAERPLFASEASRRRRLSNAASRTIRTGTALRRRPGSF